MIIELLDGTRFDIANYDLGLEDYDIPSVEIEHTTATIDGLDNPIVTETKFTGRTIPVMFCYLASDYQDYVLLRNELNGLFARKIPFYIIFKDEPGKRWLVRLGNQFVTAKDLEIVGSMQVNFRCEKLYAESIGTSLDLQNRKEWDVNLWQWGMGIDWDKEYQYEHTSNSFVIENIGTETIDPCEHALEIVLKGVFASNVKITNQTTGEVYQYNRALSSTDELRIVGIRTLRNGTSDFKHTNKKLITLAIGENQLIVEGGTLTSIAFNFRFLFK